MHQVSGKLDMRGRSLFILVCFLADPVCNLLVVSIHS